MTLKAAGLVSLLLSAAVGLTACNGDSPGGGVPASVANAAVAPSSTALSSASTLAEVGASQPLPCDAASDAGTACSAAHSVTRLLTKHYTGPLFRLVRASDGAAQDIYPYTSFTLPAGVKRALIGTTNVKSVQSFCNKTSCAVSYIYDQVDLVASLKGGAFGNVPATLTLNQDGTQSLTLPSSGPGSQHPVTVLVLNGFATITLPGTQGQLKVQLQQPPVALTAQSPTLALTVGNDLPALAGSSAKLTFTSAAGRQIPGLSTLAGQAYRNRFGTVNQSIGDTDIAAYMVAGAQYDQSSPCCGTYGNMESSANPSTYVHGEIEGEMFALAFSDGAAAVFGYCEGDSNQAPTVKDPVCNGLDVNWPGVDAEAGVYLYGPQQPSNEQFVTVLSKYSPVTGSNVFAVKGGAASQSVLTALYDGVPPEAYIFGNSAGHAFNGQWQGGLSLGEGGDGSPAPVQFFEGAMISKATLSATDNAIQSSIAGFYGPSKDPNGAACYAGNLINAPLSLTEPEAWNQSNGGTAQPATDIYGTSQRAALVTATNGSPVANIHEIIRVQGGQAYTFNDYVLATTNATAFPGGSIQTDDPSGTEFAWALNTNTGAIVRGTWGAGQPTALAAVRVGNWWKVTMTFTAPAGSNNASVFIDPPTSNATGDRSQQTPYLSATHYCPSLSMVTASNM
ncbi:alpha-amylase [Trinickia dabaoshanensis]|uniref:Alpha-amylase n=1 Tax=Trinickia dabaoshanensis TaxID=564714 RepID=A0A2N7VHM4_9BURK|nr:arabinofuranosidase catalytic domain-containing protein [Trinickia dabaoshanensis]PMS16654.1 alpha-amylase [Trinickia dabaoshanensis]